MFYSHTANLAKRTVERHDKQLAEFEAFLVSAYPDETQLLGSIKPNDIRAFRASLQSRDTIYLDHDHCKPILNLWRRAIGLFCCYFSTQVCEQAN